MSNNERGTTGTPATSGFRKAMRTVWDNVPFLAIVAIAFFGSFNHIVELAERHGQKNVEAMAIAVVVDLLCYVGAKERNRDKKLGRQPKWGVVAYPTVVLTLGVVTTLTANLATASRGTWGHIVAAIPAAVLLLVIALLERRTTFTPKIAVPVPGKVPGTAAVEPVPVPGWVPAQTREPRYPVPALPVVPGTASPELPAGYREVESQPAQSTGMDASPASAREETKPEPDGATSFRSESDLEEEALSILAAHKEATGKRMNTKDLAVALGVRYKRALVIRSEIQDREGVA